MDEVLGTQLKRLETDRIDYYLLHMLTDFASWEKLKSLGILDFIQKAKGTARLSIPAFHIMGTAMILS